MLHNVNLLPWRDERREAHKRRFLGLVVLGVLLAVLMQFGAGEYLSGQVAQQRGTDWSFETTHLFAGSANRPNSR